MVSSVTVSVEFDIQLYMVSVTHLHRRLVDGCSVAVPKCNTKF